MCTFLTVHTDATYPSLHEPFNPSVIYLYTYPLVTLSSIHLSSQILRSRTLIHLYIHQSILPSIYPSSIYPPIRPTYLATYSAMHLSTSQSIHPSRPSFIHPPVHLSAQPCIYPPVHPTVPSIYLSCQSTVWPRGGKQLLTLTHAPLLLRLLSALSPVRGLRAVVRETGVGQLLEVRTLSGPKAFSQKVVECCLSFRSGTTTV